jgi:hypothetical protein
MTLAGCGCAGSRFYYIVYKSHCLVRRRNNALSGVWTLYSTLFMLASWLKQQLAPPK